MRITNYGRAIIIACMGIYMATATSGLFFSLVGGVFIGSALVLARKSANKN